MKENSAAQAATRHPIDEAIVILTEEADSLSECHTLKPGDWAGEPEAKARYDHVQAVVAALSKLRAPADEQNVLCCDAVMDFRRSDAAFPAQPLPVFTAGKWTYDGTGQSFDYKDLDEAAFSVYRAAQASAPVADLRPHLEWALRRIRTSLDTGDKYEAAQAALDAAKAAPVASAPVAMSETERSALTGLIAVARAAFNVADDAEDDGDQIKVDRADADALGAALDTLEELPDDQPGYAMGPSNKAEWALRRLLDVASAPVATRQYHYRMSNCTPGRPECRDGNGYPECPCWHDVGTGPLAGKEATATDWRDKPSAPVQWPTMPPSKGQSPVLFEDGYAEGWAKCMDECRRALVAASNYIDKLGGDSKTYRAALASAPVDKPAPEHFKPPFDNCSFRMCDLPGQCRGEGKCHHPASAPVAGEAVNADFLASWEAQRHAGNEWADMATNGIQWMRNVKDGISTPEKALECLASDLAHCRATQARAGITPPAAPQASADTELQRALGNCRDAFAAPAAGSELEQLWAEAMSDPLAVPAYVKACAAAPQGSALDAEYSRGRADGFDAGHNAALEKAAAAVEDHQRAGREWIPASLWDTLSREAAARIRALKQPQADKDGGQQRKRYVVLKASGSRYAYVNDTQEGRSINRFDVLKGDGWKYAHEFADRMNKEHERAALSAPQAEQGERDA